jgi:DNA-binding CsgD family transcriptional regulator
MAKAEEGGRRRFSVLPASAPAESTEMPPTPGSPPAGWREVILGGRRYRLIPLGQDAGARTDEEPVTNLLTARELQIVALVAQGRVNKQIADDLQISEWTVSTHLRRIFAKLGVDTRAAMVSRCLGALWSPGTGSPRL